ncbi:hypothetical protein P280DRAFT_441310 [Massarina eburnea CBS 473.64]|uniref:Uncharacterized protein n=1 Tax=Massarina eburnea CBS 473.64 TaxID=1395130 RepID=A0A6A6SJQ1_9PLEO|nr:hypothetical protein P280DRAFT_441310 [Massarina eburnea CBS 473.64]
MDRSAKPIFNFVNLSHPDELKDSETQLRIRRLAMKEVGRSRRKPKTKRERNELILEFRRPSASASAIEGLGVGQADPFGSYPIELDDTSRGLVAFIFRNDGAHSRQLRGAWYPVGLSDPAAFYNILSNARLYMLKDLSGAFPRQDDALSLSYQNVALRLLREKMKDPRQHDSDQLLAAITSFMSHHYILGSFDGWGHHRNAMTRVIQLRGGFENVNAQELRLTISWSDLIGSFAQDIPTIVPLPLQWLTSATSPSPSTHPTHFMSLEWKRQLPTVLDWITIFDDITQIISLDRGISENDLHRAATTGSWLEPTIARLLSIRPLARGTERENVMEEVCRLGTMLFLAPIWRHLGASPVWTFNISRNLQNILLANLVEWYDLKPLLVWSVYSAAVETRDPQERSQFAFMLAVLMSGMDLEWEGLMMVVRSVLWVEMVFEGSDEALGREVISILQMPTGSVTPLTEEVEGDAV